MKTLIQFRLKTLLFLCFFSSLLNLYLLFISFNKTEKGQLLGINDHGKKLTHLIVIFDSKYLEELYDTLSFWESNPPASSRTNITLLLCAITTRKRGKIIRNNEYDINRRMSSLIRSMFKDIQIHHISVPGALTIEEDKKRVVFEKIFGKKLGISGMEYSLLCDINIYPIKSNWLSDLSTLVENRFEPFWIMGSINKGNQEIKELGPKEEKYDEAYRAKFYQIHDNAIYDFSDKIFMKTCLDILRNMPNGRKFDIELYRRLFSPQNFIHSRSFSHKYIYTDTIQEFWKSPRRDNGSGASLIHNIKGGPIIVEDSLNNESNEYSNYKELVEESSHPPLSDIMY
eukprot:GHVP01031032.1.p1 GENE.GHVP01031032.1~~GHVP01031032.1.p1  ORF type:complete len:342 (-),score=44.46 GHVP01031032.1:18-1043(-)